jgi:hypothetical protein
MVALVGERPGRGWRPGRRDELAAPEGRSPASGSCGPARRPGPRRLGDGSAPAPRRARVLEPGQHQAGRRLGDSKARPSVLGRVGGPGVVAGRLPAAPGSGCAMPRAGRGWGLAAGGRLGSARRPGSGGSSRPIPRTAEPPQRSSGSAVTTVLLGVGKLSGRRLLGVVATVPALRNWLPIAHDRSSSRSVQPWPTSAWSSSRWWRALPPCSCRTRSCRRWLGMPTGCSEDRASARASPAEENTLVKQLNALRLFECLCYRFWWISREAVCKSPGQRSVVGAGGVEPPSFSVSAKPREPLC